MSMAPGDSGEAVRQLQHRLGAAGYLPVRPVTPEMYCSATEEGVAAFQDDRGLTVTGLCDDDTWTALLEAEWNLGDRALMLRSPNLRGDDVAELQRLLSRLGFDCGRIDGIFGQKVLRSLSDFQLNAGLEMDGVCHLTTVTVLKGLSRMTGDGPGIAAVRNAEESRSGQPLAGKRVAIGQNGEFEELRLVLGEAVRQHGAMLIEITEQDARSQGHTANLFGADVYIGLESSVDFTSRVDFYAVPTFESTGGRALAHLVERHLRDVVPRINVGGMRLPILRETKMPAVLITLGPASLIARRTQRIADAIFLALSAWAP